MARTGRWSLGRTPTGNPFRKTRHAIQRRFSDRDLDVCVKCDRPRWEHEAYGLVPDHDFVKKDSEGSKE
jgi:hypothetical protein